MKTFLKFPVLALAVLLCAYFAATATVAQTQLNLNTGTTANDGTGDSLQLAMRKIQTNFNSLFGSRTNVTNGFVVITNLVSQGSLVEFWQTKTTNYTITTNDFGIRVTVTGLTMTLPASSNCAFGQVFEVKVVGPNISTTIGRSAANTIGTISANVTLGGEADMKFSADAVANFDPR